MKNKTILIIFIATLLLSPLFFYKEIIGYFEHKDIKQYSELVQKKVATYFQDENIKKCAELVKKEQFKLAKIYCKKSVQKGNETSFYNMGVVYLQENNAEQAVKFLTLSTKNNDLEAYIKLAQLYKNGILVEKDEERAYQFYKKACQLQDPDSCAEVSNFIKLKEKAKQTLQENEKLNQELKKSLQELEEQKIDVEKQRQQLEQKRIEEIQKLNKEQVTSVKPSQNLPDKPEVKDKAQEKEQALLEKNKLEKEVVAKKQELEKRRLKKEELVKKRALIKAKREKKKALAKKQKLLEQQRKKKLQQQNIPKRKVASSLSYIRKGKFYEGLAKAKKPNGKWGFVNKSGDWIISPVLDSAGNFKNGKAEATLQGQKGYINRYGQWDKNGKW